VWVSLSAPMQTGPGAHPASYTMCILIDIFSDHVAIVLVHLSI